MVPIMRVDQGFLGEAPTLNGDPSRDQARVPDQWQRRRLWQMLARDATLEHSTNDLIHRQREHDSLRCQAAGCLLLFRPRIRRGWVTLYGIDVHTRP